MHDYDINRDLNNLSFSVHQNQTPAELYEEVIRRDEGSISCDGALVVTTGTHTGRSPKNKFIVYDDLTSRDVYWGSVNQKMTKEQFDLLYRDMGDYIKSKDNFFVQDLYAGAQKKYQTATRIITEYAWHALFIRNLLIRPSLNDATTTTPDFVPEFTIIDCPDFLADTIKHGAVSSTMIACDFTRKIVLIAGTAYAGEIKKSVFSMLNYLLPKKHVMPMHASVNTDKKKESSAIFFGLSGTGKTTLSQDPNRLLIGDDEHGWSKDGLFNFEGGCYAKMIRLSAQTEPEIFSAARRFGTVLENVVMDSETRSLDFDNTKLAQNSRGAYPLTSIANADLGGVAVHPSTIVMLTCDAFGVLPPVAHLTIPQAIYHFLSGYTAKVAGTECGIREPEVTFSACFGAPFMSLHPTVYGKLLRQYITSHSVSCWLLNTGWTGGVFGIGQRMPISFTRSILHDILNNKLSNAQFKSDKYFGFDVPVMTEADIKDSYMLCPRDTWSDKDAFDQQVKRLVASFIQNFKPFESLVERDVLEASPQLS